MGAPWYQMGLPAYEVSIGHESGDAQGGVSFVVSVSGSLYDNTIADAFVLSLAEAACQNQTAVSKLANVYPDATPVVQSINRVGDTASTYPAPPASLEE